ncbi:MAG TPA: hypothetical protein VKB80_27800, partial [Kofleriaceae bacterium]|nr:hypothetical protein [Kofleriaceae bacterium]
MGAEGNGRPLVALDGVGVPLWTVDLEAARAAFSGNGAGTPDGELGLLSANRAALELFGAASEGELRQGLTRVLTPETRAGLGQLLAGLGDVAPSTSGEVVVASLTGELRTALVTCRVDPGSTERALAVVTFLDVSEARRAELELSELRGRRRELLDGFPDLVFEIGADGVYTGFAGPRDACSVPPAAFLGHRADEVMVPEIGRAAL